MIPRFTLLLLALAVAGCAAKGPAQPNAPQARIPAPPPRGEPGEYLNMAATNLQATLGRPAFVRKDGATQMWRYDGAACRAFFFLYGAPLAVRHVETLPHGAQNAADIACLTALRAAPAKTS
jgi:predicted small lipoprotein YifL